MRIRRLGPRSDSYVAAANCRAVSTVWNVIVYANRLPSPIVSCPTQRLIRLGENGLGYRGRRRQHELFVSSPDCKRDAS